MENSNKSTRNVSSCHRVREKWKNGILADTSNALYQAGKANDATQTENQK